MATLTLFSCLFAWRSVVALHLISSSPLALVYLLVAPVPGYDWLSRISSEETTFEYNGITYSSAYHAMLYGDPAQHACRNFNCWLNALFFSPHIAAWLAHKLGVEAGHYVLCYFRNLLGGAIVYYGTAAVFSYQIYIARGEEIFKNRKRPSLQIMWDQIRLAQASLFLYVFLPVFDEYLIEQGYTRVYYTVDEIGGLAWYIMTHLVYFSLVEIGIYWMHRTLHTNKFLYKYVHMLHHKYNRPDTLTPWASIAFHPLDGILQASPYVMVLPLVPCHYVTHVCMLFFTAVWATVSLYLLCRPDSDDIFLQNSSHGFFRLTRLAACFYVHYCSIFMIPWIGISGTLWAASIIQCIIRTISTTMDKSLPFAIDSGEPFESRKDRPELEENENHHNVNVML